MLFNSDYKVFPKDHQFLRPMFILFASCQAQQVLLLIMAQTDARESRAEKSSNFFFKGQGGRAETRTA